MNYPNWGPMLKQCFPVRDAALEEEEWKTLKQRLQTGQEVKGVVIAKAQFGAWIDIGVGFPALLEIIEMADLTLEKYRTDDWCPIGSEVKAKIAGFTDRLPRQIVLKQKNL